MTVQPNNFKWGISTLGCHELDLPATCELAERHGIHNLEIRSLADCLNLPEYLDRIYENCPADAKSILEQHNQSVIALNSGFKLIEIDEAAREELLGFARWAELLDVPLIRVFGGGSMDEPLTESDIAAAVENLKWWEEQRSKNSWSTDVALETHGGFSSSQRCLALEKSYGKSLRIIWDTHHTWKQGGESARETWQLMGSSIEHIHIKDSIPVPSARHPYSYVLPGKGDFPVAEVYDVLLENNYDGIVSLEWERKWHPYMPDLESALNALIESGWRSAAAAKN